MLSASTRARRWPRRLVACVAGIAGVAAALLWAAEARAIPAFARAYETPCSTCHITITRRSEFGDSFRRLGFHWPGPSDADEKVRKEKPFSMKGVALLEGKMPARLPLSLSGRLSASWTNDESALDSVAVGSPALSFMFGSALGENVSFFGVWNGAGSPNELYLHFARLLGGPELNLKVGRFEQWTTLFKNNEALLSPFSLSSGAVAGHSVGAGRVGAEASGVLLSRGFWAAGVVQNGGPGSGFDKYYHLGLKLGGMDFLGEEPDIDLDAEESVLDDLALTVGHWGYMGEVSDVTGETTAEIIRFGLDFKAYFRHWSLWGGFMLGLDEDVTRGAHLDSHTAFAELSYPALSWLLPMYLFQVQDASDLQESTIQHDLGALILLQENVRARVRFGYSDDGIDNEVADIQVLFAL